MISPVLIGHLQTPLGFVRIEVANDRVKKIYFVDELEKKANIDTNDILKNAMIQLQEYFLGKRKKFDIPFAVEGTDFQKKVWDIVSQIPYGGQITYTEIAKELNNPQAVQAIDLVNGQNPVLILIPCHRVIRKDGNLVGYAGGIHRKEWLLSKERKEQNLF